MTDRPSLWLPAALALLFAATVVHAAPPAPFEPQVGQPGKDVIWVPTPEPVLERMLKAAQVTRDDHVVDLGAGDGRLVIMAADRFGARATGLEYDAKLVEFARLTARKAGLTAPRFRMVKADIFTADFSYATVIGVYLLSDMLNRLRPSFQRLRPGTRIVSHHFKFDEWEPDEVSWVGVRGVYLWIVPAPVAGGWRLTTSLGLEVELSLEQTFQRFRGRVELPTVKAGLRHTELRGDAIGFTFVDDHGVRQQYSGRVVGDRIEGTVRAGDLTGTFTAARIR